MEPIMMDFLVCTSWGFAADANLHCVKLSRIGNDMNLLAVGLTYCRMIVRQYILYEAHFFQMRKQYCLTFTHKLLS